MAAHMGPLHPPQSCHAFFLRSCAFLAFAFLYLLPCPISAAQLAQNVLVVYNSANSNSVSVATYYQAKRGIPVANLCPITPTSTTSIAWNDFVSTVRTPVLNCLNALGWNNILYIVFTYQTPYSIVGPDSAIYALDQFIADPYDFYMPAGQFGEPTHAHPYYVEAQSQGNAYAPFLSFAAFRSQNSVPIFSVWRLDAATEALAQGLVDKALAAESSGLSGQMCIDEWVSTPTYDYISSGSPDWDLRKAAMFGQQAGFALTQDFNTAEFGTSPAPLSCSNAALYSGGYSLNHYNDAFTWNTGAIGFHLDSGSGYSPRTGTNWSANALQRGITVTSGAVSEPFWPALPHPDQVFRNLFEGANVGDAFMRNTMFLKWTIMNMGDPLYVPFPAGFASITAPQDSLALNPRYLVGGNPSTGTITLATAAPSGGLTIALQSNQTTVATVQPSVTVAAGQNTASFPISTNLVTHDAPLYITATFGTSTLTNTLVPTALLGNVVFSPVSVIGGNYVLGTVFLKEAAPAGGIQVTLSSNNSAVSVPASVSFSAGTTSAQFDITTTGVAAVTTVTISASYAGAVTTAALVLNPVIPTPSLSPASVVGGNSTLANKVLLNGVLPQDLVVSLSSSDPAVTPPASVTITAFTTSSPVFTINTSSVNVTKTVTISATCGGVTRTAVLTVYPFTATPGLSPTTVVGGVSTTLNKVMLNAPAPAGGAIVTLTSSDPSATVPGSVTVPAGSYVSPYFTITTSAVSVPTTAVISAIYNGVTETANLSVTPVGLLSVTLSPTSVAGGVSTTLNKVTLSGPAPAGGATVTLTSSDPSATVPGSVTVAAGSTSSPYFTITTSAVSATTTPVISVTYNGVTKNANLTVTPVGLVSVNLGPSSVVGGVPTTSNTVTLNGPAPAGGATVTLTSSDPSATVPASVTVTAGSTSSPSFTITTSAVAVTTTPVISATYSGVTKTANLTVTPIALISVTLSPTSVAGGVPTTLNKVTLNGPAPTGGVTVTLSSSDPSATVPGSVTVTAGSTSSPYFTITTSAVAATTTPVISATFKGTTKTANLTVTPIAIISVALAPSSVVGGSPTTSNKVTLNGPAPAGGITVTLTSSDPSATVPGSVLVAAGSTSSAYFTITTSVVSAATTPLISAIYNGVTKSANLTVNPLVASPSLSPSAVVGGVSTTLNKVLLNGPAPPGGITITLTSSDPSATVPGSVTVAAGSTVSPYFTITTSSVSTTTTAVISAIYNGVTKTANLMVNPAALASMTLSPSSVVGGASTTLNKVSLNGPAPPGGITVTLSSSDPSATVPASVTVAAGSTVSPYFTITTSAVAATTTPVISATYNGVTVTANLTVNP